MHFGSTRYHEARAESGHARFSCSVQTDWHHVQAESTNEHSFSLPDLHTIIILGKSIWNGNLWQGILRHGQLIRRATIFACLYNGHEMYLLA